MAIRKKIEALRIFNEKEMPNWSTDLSDLDINEIIHYMENDANTMNESWDQVREYIKKQTVDQESGG